MIPVRIAAYTGTITIGLKAAMAGTRYAWAITSGEIPEVIPHETSDIGRRAAGDVLRPSAV